MYCSNSASSCTRVVSVADVCCFSCTCICELLVRPGRVLQATTVSVSVSVECRAVAPCCMRACIIMLLGQSVSQSVSLCAAAGACDAVTLCGGCDDALQGWMQGSMCQGCGAVCLSAREVCRGAGVLGVPELVLLACMDRFGTHFYLSAWLVVCSHTACSTQFLSVVHLFVGCCEWWCACE